MPPAPESLKISRSCYQPSHVDTLQLNFCLASCIKGQKCQVLSLAITYHGTYRTYQKEHLHGLHGTSFRQLLSRRHRSPRHRSQLETTCFHSFPGGRANRLSGLAWKNLSNRRSWILEFSRFMPQTLYQQFMIIRQFNQAVKHQHQPMHANENMTRSNWEIICPKTLKSISLKTQSQVVGLNAPREECAKQSQGANRNSDWKPETMARFFNPNRQLLERSVNSAEHKKAGDKWATNPNCPCPRHNHKQTRAN